MPDPTPTPTPSPAPTPPNLPDVMDLPSEPAPPPTPNPAPPTPPPPGATTTESLQAADTERQAELDRMFARRRGEEAPIPPVTATPPTPTPAPPKAKPPEPAKPPTPAPAPEPKPGEPAKPPATDDLPADLLEGIPEKPSQSHREAQHHAAESRRRLVKAQAERVELQKRIKELETKGAVPADYEDLKQKAQQLETEKTQEAARRKETEDRLYAVELRERPEYQQHVVEPWKAVQNTITTLCTAHNVSADHVWQSLKLPAKERKSILSEIAAPMDVADQQEFFEAIRAIPRITEAKNVLEANSKERLTQLRANDQAREEAKRTDVTARALNAQKQHREARMSAMPYLYQVEGDAPEIKAYNDGMQRDIALAEKFVKDGIDKLPPEVQAKMAFDAVTSGRIMAEYAHVFQLNEARIKELETTLQERETTIATQESELAEYRGAGPTGGHASAPVGGGGKDPMADMSPGERVAQSFSHLRR